LHRVFNHFYAILTYVFNPQLHIYDIHLLANVACFFVECLPEDDRKKPKH